MPETLQPQPYLTTQEVAQLLRRSSTTIWRLTRRPVDPLPGRRLGGTLLFVADEVTQWINRQPTANPASQRGAV